VESYLYAARGHRALEQSVLAEGERRGFSERRLRRAAESLGIVVTARCWELSAHRAAELDARQIRTLGERPVSLRPVMPSMQFVSGDARLRRRAA
jgi:hypothetical protein